MNWLTSWLAWNFDSEHAAFSDFWRDGNWTAQLLDKLLDDGKADTCPAILSGHAHVDLPERIEDLAQVSFRNSTTSIADLNDQTWCILPPIQGNAAVNGKLASIGQQIIDDMA